MDTLKVFTRTWAKFIHSSTNMHFLEPGCWGPWGQSVDTLFHHFPHWTPISHRGGDPLLTPLRTQLWGQGGRILKSGRGSWVCFCSEIGYKHWTWNSCVRPGYLVINTGKTSDCCQREKSDITLFYLRATHFFLKSLRKELRKPPFWSCLGFWSLKEVCSLSLSSLGQNRVASSKCISWKHKRGMLFYSFPKYMCPGCGTVLWLRLLPLLLPWLPVGLWSLPKCA